MKLKIQMSRRACSQLVTVLLASSLGTAVARPGSTVEQGDLSGTAGEESTSPVLKIERRPDRRRDDSRDDELYRTFDGSDNNLLSPEMNESETALRRLVPSDYGDLSSTMAGDLRPSPRAISNAINAQTESTLSPVSASDYLWQWGQFLDHDLDLTDGVVPAEPANIAIPPGDAWFDPGATGTATMPFNRSIYDTTTGSDPVDPRQHLNEITGWIDASNVYCSDVDRATAQVCQRIDVYVVDDVRNFLFGEPGSGGFDLASLNIQRGRDHGLPGYNAARQALGLSIKTSFAEITDSVEIQEKLAAVYGTVDDMDVWVAGLAEDPVPGSALGELFHTIVVAQFEVLRDGDRFWYERSLSNGELREVAGTRLADIIRRNTTIGGEINNNVFVVGRSVAGRRAPNRR